MRDSRAIPALRTFAILLGSYAFFWHARDWNVSSRLMLTYALVDRGTVSINGLEDHTRDRARLGDRFYSDKQPGFSLLAVPVYAVGKSVFGLPAHPLERKGPTLTHWTSDYWITLFTSGLLSALAGALLVVLSMDLGCGPRRALLIGLAYGLAMPAYVYATLSVGHQATAFLLLGAFASLRKAAGGSRPRAWGGLAGLMAAMAAVVELQVGPASAVLGFYLIFLVMARRVPPSCLATFALGASVPTAMLLVYNVAAFGSPFDMGYFHEDLAEFRKVHGAANPLGLRGIDWARTPDLLWGEHRGLLVFAPILLLTPLGLIALAVRKRWETLIVSVSICLAVFLVNLSYPEWTGGWSTGPRLLVPLLPFAILPVAALLAEGWRSVTALAIVLAIVGGVEMLLFQGVGGRIPNGPGVFSHPLREVVWPLWRGDPLPRWREGVRFDRTLLSATWPGVWQFLPLVLGQMVAIGIAVRPRPKGTQVPQK